MKLVNRIRCYDNGGASADRFTVIFLDTNRMIDEDTVEYDCVSMSIAPNHPQGVCLHGPCRLPNSTLGLQIEFLDLPLGCQMQVKEELGWRSLEELS